MASDVFEFGQYRLAPFELRRGDTRVPLEPTPVSVLYHLAANRHRPVSRAELRQVVWADTFVEPNAVHQTITRIRKAFAQDPKAPQVIETVSRRGWRFLPNVRVVSETHSDVTGAEQPPTPFKKYESDGAQFVRDVNYPDGSIVVINETFVKSWEIQNVGMLPWIDRYLSRQGPTDGPGRLKSADKVPIPSTMPGDSVVVSVELQAPPTPGSCYAEWKMTDSKGHPYLPHQIPIFISIDVREKRSYTSRRP